MSIFDGVQDLGSFELIPINTLAWCRVEVQKDDNGSINFESKGGNKYLKLKLHLVNSNYDGAYIFDNIIYTGSNVKGNPNETWALQKMKCIFKTSEIPTNEFKSMDDALNKLDGLIVGVKIGHTKPNDNGNVYAQVKTYISPTIEEKPNKEYNELVEQSGKPPLELISKIMSVSSIDEDDIPF